MKKPEKIALSAFTLIELLVSSTIILLLIVAAAPSYDKVQSKARLRSGGETLRNCLTKAKSLALAPEIDVADLISYSATLYSKSHSINANSCIVYRNTKASDSTVISTVIEKFSLSSSVRISRFSQLTSVPDEFRYIFENKNHGQATREADPNNEINDLAVEDEKLNCLQLKFFYETGEILLEKSGTISTAGQCIEL